MSNAFIVSAAVAPLNAEPRASSEQASQLLAGHRLERLEERAPWLRVRAPDGYEGWVHRGYVSEITERELAKRYTMARISLGCTVCEIGGGRRALPVRAIIADDAFVEHGVALTPSELVAHYPPTPGTITRTAQQLFEGTSYQWGGITPWGADCSGFVQTTFALHGIAMPRDARQQAEGGVLVEGGLGALHAGDLLFFAENAAAPVSHVALALDDHRMAHLALGRGGYAEDRLTDRDDPYIASLVGRFRFARRLPL